jgi:hypothetical protein
MNADSLRPLGLGEILDVAIKVYTRRFAALAKVVAAFVVPVYLLAALVQLSVLPDNEADAVDVNFWTVAAALIVTGLIVYLATVLATAGAFRVVSSTYLGEETEWQDSLRFTTARLGPLVWVSFLGGLGVVLGLVLCIIPGVYLYGLWAVAVPVLLFEDVRGTRALGRSRHLVSGRWWSVFGTVVLATILASLVSNVITGIVQAVLAGGDSDVLDALGGAIGGIVAGVITTPFLAAVTAVLYYDLRVRKEGFDLELLARRWHA